MNGSIDGVRRERAVRRVALAVVLFIVAAMLALSQSPLLRNLTRAPAPVSQPPSAPAIADVVGRARAAQSSRDYTSAIPLWTQVLAASPASTEALGSRAHA